MARGNEPAEGLLAAARLGLTDKLKLALDQASCDVVNAKDETGRTALHHAASCGYEDCVELLLERGADGSIQDEAGDTPLHLAAQAGLPMPSYQVCSKFPAACLAPDASGRTPVDLAVASSRGEVLNAMLLACSGSGSEAALASMRALLARGAVCDTWAPSGSSALMLVASADSRPGVELLLAHGATMELQDALGRTALMFAAGNGARGALGALLAAGASLSVRDRRGRNVLDYAGAGTPVRAALEERLRELETKSAALQEALLAEVLGEGVRAGGVQAAAPGAGKKAKKKAKKKGKGGVPGAKAAAAGPAVDGDAEEAEEAVVEACAAREGPAETGAAGDSGAAGDAGTAGEQAGAPAGEPLPPTDMMGGPTGVADSPADPHAPLDPAATSSSEDEVALLRLQLASLQAALDRSELARRVEAAAAEEEAAAHAAALTKAVLAERMECVVRFASFLQNHGPAVLATMPELLGNGFASLGFPPPSASQTFGADAVPRPSPPLAFSGPMGRTSLDAAFQSPTHTLHSGFGAGVPPPSFMGHAPRYGGAEARTRGDPHALHPAGYPADGGNKPAPAFFTLNLGTTC
ncbi:Putative ankyrin repeat protein [Auxenochlorella protothecoides]|uniref:Putative ankyrin repeat protein n=1 Tax=Auxenochlorella protothecoides TaxID=3075 RepID=A0A087SH17_AUXPR|nr:Putative ankyrin repeat protein [Auxenochlorella protothecoides]KFM25021.1 Putative ankyrin repeat protein [Auxenochlorella protothecoides]